MKSVQQLSLKKPLKSVPICPESGPDPVAVAGDIGQGCRQPHDQVLVRHRLTLLIPTQQQIALADQTPQTMRLPNQNLVNRRFGSSVVAQHQRGQREPKPALGHRKTGINSRMKVNLLLICARCLQC